MFSAIVQCGFRKHISVTSQLFHGDHCPLHTYFKLKIYQQLYKHEHWSSVLLLKNKKAKSCNNSTRLSVLNFSSKKTSVNKFKEAKANEANFKKYSSPLNTSTAHSTCLTWCLFKTPQGKFSTSLDKRSFFYS